MRFQQSQRNKLRSHFSNHVFYKLCQETHDVFLHHCPSIIISTEDLFADATKTLDSLLIMGDFDAKLCKNLWNDTFVEYRQQDGVLADTETSGTEVAMLFYVVMLGLQSVEHSHYRGKLQRTLHESVHMMWNRQKEDNCQNIEKRLRVAVNPLTSEMLEWMNVYFSSAESLTAEIGQVLHPNLSSTEGGLPLPKSLNTRDAQKYFQIAIDKGWMEFDGSKFTWIGCSKTGIQSQLAYFCGRVFGYENAFNGNAGKAFPEEDLNKLFGVKRLYSSLQQVYVAKRKQQWRTCIDEIFE